MVSTPPPESQSHGRRQLRSKQPPLLACGGTYANASDVPVYQDVQGSTTYYPPIFADAPAELAAQLPPPAYGDSSACTSDVRVYQDAQGRTTYHPPIFADASAGQVVRSRVGADRDGAGV